MFGIMLQKMWHKKWMNVSLLLGCILLIGTVISFPLYRNAALNRMLQEEFTNYIQSKGKWPMMLIMTSTSKKDKGGKNITKMENFLDGVYDDMGVGEYDTIFHYSLPMSEAYSTMNRSDSSYITMRLSGMTDFEDHVSMLSGELFSTNGVDEDGNIEVIVSQSCMVTNNLLVGEVIEFDNLFDPDKNHIRIVIKGVFERSSQDDFFWQSKPESMSHEAFMNMDVFKEMFTGANAEKYTIVSNNYALFNYEDVKATDVERILERTKYYTEESGYKSVIRKVAYLSTINDYLDKENRISQTLIILQVPVLVMLAAFLLMISGQMYEMERNEISVIKSRGSSGNQILRMYFYQSVLITFAGLIVGAPLGFVLSKILGSTKNFLEFDLSRNLKVSFTLESLIYAGVAVLVCLLSITLPAIKHSKITIVNLKQQKALKKKALWEKLYIDIVLLGISLYGFYSFRKNASVAVDVTSGKSLDPLLYISSSLFILGAGLLFLRLQPHIVKLIYLLGSKKWGPAAHVSFMENIKNGKKQQLIMLFLIITISLGMYHATVARTILDNAVENEDYLVGADVIVKEVWTVMVSADGSPTDDYIIPDYSKYAKLKNVKQYTKVIYDNAGYIYEQKNDRIPATVMGINTKEFGEITSLDRRLLDKHYYSYLNDLAVVEDGVLVSKNFNTKLGYEVGDRLTYYNGRSKSFNGKIVGFFDYFPGYLPTETAVNADGSAFIQDNYCVVAHFEHLNNKYKPVPYEVWMSADEDVQDEIVSWISDNSVKVSKYVNKANNLEQTMKDPLLQGTNGVLTMGFAVTIILCAVGYLIYWVMSIRERELMFGILRATGLHKSEIFLMLIIEQIFSGLFSILAGVGIGKLASTMFVPILQQAYASKKQALPMRLITDVTDMIRLYGVIGLVMIIALLVLLVLVLRMNVTKALKLGEE